MKVLHLFSNAKWTGPAEPALNLVVALRALGVEADFACSPDSGDSINKIVETARDRGVEPILEFRLDKHRHPIKNFLDSRALKRYLDKHRYDLLHCHLDNDHRIAVHASRALNIPIVRSSYEGEGFSATPSFRRLLASASVVCEPSSLAMNNDAHALGLSHARMRVIPVGVDTERFNPAREVPDGRKWLNVPADAFVVGIVARMQRHRHFEDFFQGVKRLCDQHPNVHVIVVGRGTYQESVGKEPVRALGLEGRVHFSGYVDGENYVGMLKALDVEVLMVPGSDGTCRAVREALAMGKPAIVTTRGMLPELVVDGETGHVFDGTPEGLFRAISPLASDRARLRQMGRAARGYAEAHYALSVQASAIAEVYRSVLPS